MANISNIDLAQAKEGPGFTNVKERWAVNSVTDDTATDEVIKVSGGANTSLVVERIFINCVVDATVVIKEEGDAQQLGGFKFLAAAPTNVDIVLKRPWVLTEDKDLEVNHGGIACSILVEGFTTTA